MAKLPGFDSRAQMTISPSGTMIDVEAAGQTGRDIQKVGSAIGDVAQVWQNATNFSQKLTAKNNADAKMADIKLRALQDKDINNSNDYHVELDKVREESLQGFTDNTARLEFSAHLNNDVNTAKIGIDSLYRNKLINHTEAESMRSHDRNRERFFAGDEKAKEEQLFIVQNQFENGFISEETLVDKERRIASWDTERLKTVEIRKKLIDEQIELTQVNNELALIENFTNTGLAGLSADDVISRTAAGEVNPKFGQALVEYMNDPLVYNKAKRNNKAFNAYMEEILDSKDKKAVNAILEQSLKNKNIAKDDLSVMIGLAVSKSASLEAVNTDSGTKPSADTSIFTNLKNLFGWSKESEKTQAIKIYTDKIKTGASPDKALDETKKQITTQTNPKLKSIPKDGVILVDKYGNKGRVFSDGSWEPVK